jgi:hypothetical protein
LCSLFGLDGEIGDDSEEASVWASASASLEEMDIEVAVVLDVTVVVVEEVEVRMRMRRRNSYSSISERISKRNWSVKGVREGVEFDIVGSSIKREMRCAASGIVAMVVACDMVYIRPWCCRSFILYDHSWDVSIALDNNPKPQLWVGLKRCVSTDFLEGVQVNNDGNSEVLKMASCAGET